MTTAFLEKGEPLRERSPQHSVSTKGLGPCASQPGGPFSSKTALGLPRAGSKPLPRVVESLSGASVGRFEMLPDPGLGPDPYLKGLTLLVEQRLALRRGQPLRLDHRRTVR
jgi:hypothetical protein